ncbi:MAG: hypothetical protein Q9225_003742 [Loekoesia sp. 1 TL-2023]
MPSATSPPKSILKPSSNLSKDIPTPPTLSREERNRQLALHHARLLQYRKDIEARNLASTEILLDLPSSSSASPAEPSAIDTQAVRDALRTFQPSDYDALVEERNIDHKCGYVLCLRENRRQDSTGEYRIVTGRVETDFKVVKSNELERWCSDECGKMTLYLRVQLSEEPAWAREWQAAELLDLYSEKKSRETKGHDDISSISHVSGKPEKSDVEQSMGCRMRELAIERGDKGQPESLSAKVAIEVKENVHRAQVTPIPPYMVNSNGGSVEGYLPTSKHLGKQIPGQDEDAEDLMPTI